MFSVQCTLYGGRGELCVKFWDSALVSNRQNAASPKYNDDISLLTLQYLISALNYEMKSNQRGTAKTVNVQVFNANSEEYF